MSVGAHVQRAELLVGVHAGVELRRLRGALLQQAAQQRTVGRGASRRLGLRGGNNFGECAEPPVDVCAGAALRIVGLVVFGCFLVQRGCSV